MTRVKPFLLNGLRNSLLLTIFLILAVLVRHLRCDRSAEILYRPYETFENHVNQQKQKVLLRQEMPVKNYAEVSQKVLPKFSEQHDLRQVESTSSKRRRRQLSPDDSPTRVLQLWERIKTRQLSAMSHGGGDMAKSDSHTHKISNVNRKGERKKYVVTFRESVNSSDVDFSLVLAAASNVAESATLADAKTFKSAKTASNPNYFLNNRSTDIALEYRPATPTSTTKIQPSHLTTRSKKLEKLLEPSIPGDHSGEAENPHKSQKDSQNTLMDSQIKSEAVDHPMDASDSTKFKPDSTSVEQETDTVNNISAAKEAENYIASEEQKKGSANIVSVFNGTGEHRIAMLNHKVVVNPQTIPLSLNLNSTIISLNHTTNGIQSNGTENYQASPFNNKSIVNPDIIPVSHNSVLLNHSTGVIQFRKKRNTDEIGPVMMADDRVLALLLDVSRNLANLRDMSQSLKVQNHMLHRLLKKIDTKLSEKVLSGSVARKDPREARPQDGPYEPRGFGGQGFGQQGFEKVAWERENDYHRIRQLSNSVKPQKDEGVHSAALTSGSSSGQAAIPPAASSWSAAGDIPRCPMDGYVYSGVTGSCYGLYAERVSWITARERCHMESGRLVSIKSAQEQKVISELLRANKDTQHCDVWTGLSRYNSRTTVRRSASDSTHRARRDTLNQSITVNGVKERGWSNSSNRIRNGISEAADDGRRGKVNPIDEVKDSGWSDSPHHVRRDRINTVNGVKENKRSDFHHRVRVRRGTINAVDGIEESDWYWEGEGTRLDGYSYWNSGEPNNANGEEHCVQLLWVFGWRWNDASCHRAAKSCFICKSN